MGHQFWDTTFRVTRELLLEVAVKLALPIDAFTELVGLFVL